MSAKRYRDFRHAGFGPSARSCQSQERWLVILYISQQVVTASKLAVYFVLAKFYTSNLGPAAVKGGRNL